MRAHLRFLGVTMVLALCAMLVTLVGCKEPVGPPAPATVGEAAAPVVTVVAHREPATPVPRAALPYRADLIRTARSVWGMDAPIAAFAAQIAQESGWRADVVSRVGAQGLSQFMPATTKWIAGLDAELRDAQPFNPAWAMRAMVVYDQWLYQRAPAHYAPRDRMWVSLRGYNGGLGHWQQEAARTGVAQPTREQVDAACGKARRAAAHCPENLGYPHRILDVLQPVYASWGTVL